MSSKILAFTYYDKSFEKIHEIVKTINSSYFQKHDIEYIEYNYNSSNEIIGNYPYYHKFFILRHLLKTRKDIDYFFLMDCDMVICQPQFDMRMFTVMSDKNILICSTSDCSIDMYWNINSGSIIVKRDQGSIEFIESYFKLAKMHDFKINDQVIFQALLQNGYIENIAVFPKSAFNHGNINTFLFHACNDSTTNQDFEQAINKKASTLSNITKSLNELQR